MFWKEMWDYRNYDLDENDWIIFSRAMFFSFFNMKENLKTPDLINLLESKYWTPEENIEVLNLLNSKSDFSLLEKIFVIEKCFPRFEENYISSQQAKIIRDFFLWKNENETWAILVYFLSNNQLDKYIELVTTKNYQSKLNFLAQNIFTQNIFTQNIIEKINLDEKYLKILAQKIYKIHRSWIDYEDSKVLLKIFSYSDWKLWKFLSDNQKDSILKKVFQASNWEKFLLENSHLINLFETSLNYRKNFLNYLNYYGVFDSFWSFWYSHYPQKTKFVFDLLVKKDWENFIKRINKILEKNKKLDDENIEE